MGTDFRVDDEKQQICLVDRLQHLLANLEIHRQAGVFRQPTRVDEPKGAPCPLGAPKMAVSRGSSLIAHDRRVAPDQAIEQRRLADVGPADHGNDGDAHAAPRCGGAAAASPSSSSTSMKSYDG